VVPTTIDLSRYKRAQRPDNEVPVIGWTGSHTTMACLAIIHPVIQKLAQNECFELRVISSVDFSLDGVQVTSLRWRSETEVDDLRPIDIGIMPLPDTKWTRGKCALKALQFMALGIPVVCSPVGINSTLIRHGENGLLASNEQEWLSALSLLLRDADLRRRMGEAARRTVEEWYTAEKQASRMLEVFRRAAGASSERKQQNAELGTRR
jgi:glycosyltransferase involved in cell wall biosynthesis